LRKLPGFVSLTPQGESNPMTVLESILNDLPDYFIFFAGGFSVVFSAGQLLVSPRKAANWNLAALFICLGIVLWQTGLVTAGAAFRVPLALAFHVTLMFLLTPLLFFAYHLVILPEEALPDRKALLLLPTACAAAADVIFLQMESGERIHLLQDLFFAGAPHIVFVKLLFAGAALQITAYLGFLYVRLRGLGKVEEHMGILTVTMAYVVLSVMTVLLMAAGYILGSVVLLRAGAIMAGVLVVGAYLAGQRYPQFMQFLAIQAKKRRYERSLLEGMDFGAVSARLMELMEEQKLYTHEDLTLKTVSGSLAITPHQLSQLLNERFNMNFKSFVNSFRVREARRLLVEEPESSIISIAYVVGFNSKTSFYRAFARVTGRTPHEYRDDALSTPPARNKSVSL
jgi:AraC-like DNA-binding protein